MTIEFGKGKDRKVVDLCHEGVVVCRGTDRFSDNGYHYPFIRFYAASDNTPVKIIHSKLGPRVEWGENARQATILLGIESKKKEWEGYTIPEDYGEVEESSFWNMGKIAKKSMYIPRRLKSDVLGGVVLYSPERMNLAIETNNHLIYNTPSVGVHCAVHNFFWSNPSFHLYRLSQGSEEGEEGRFLINNRFTDWPTWEITSQLEYDLKVQTAFRSSEVENLIKRRD